MSFTRKHFLPLFFLALGVALIYSNSLDGSFQFDDLQIRDRPNLRVTEVSIESLKGTAYWSPLHKKIYRPLPGLTFGVNYYLGGDDPFGYHIVNITIHILCAISVYVFLFTLLSVPGIRPAFASQYRYEIIVIATFLFAFHPIQTNVATYIIQRMTSMAALFFVISVTGYISFRLQTLPNKQKSVIRKYLGIFIFIISGVFSFLSKENSAILPVIILLTDYLLFYDLFHERQREKLRRIYSISILCLLVLVCYMAPKYLVSFSEAYRDRDFSLFERLLSEPRIIFFYIYLLLIPSVGILNLNHDIPISGSIIDPPETLFAITGIVFLVGAAYFLRKKCNLFAFVIVWFLGNLVIESTVIPLELMYEHRTYLPGVMVFLLIAFGIVFVSKKVLRRNKAMLLTSALLILYGNGTYLRNVIFKTPVSLWLDVVEKSPNLARAHANLGRNYMDRGQYREAKEEFEKALKIKTDMVEPLINLGKLYLDHFGMVDEAIVYFKRALRAEPKGAYGSMALGVAYMRTKEYEKAEHFLNVAVKRWKFYPVAINNLGIAKIHLEKKLEAMKIFQYGIRTDPTHADFYFNLAKLYFNEKRFSDAERTLENYLLINKNARREKALLKVIKQRHQSTDAVEE